MPERLTRRQALTRLSTAALFTAGACSRGPSSQSSNVVHIANASGELNLLMSELMRQQQFMESFDLRPEVVAMADGTRILGGIVSGSLDMSPMSGFGQVFPAVERGANLKIINAATLLPALALYSGKPDVRTLKDLEGKVVAVGSVGALVHQLAVTLLRKYAVDISTIRFVSIGSSTDTFRGVMAGTVDAGAGPASYFDNTESYQVHGLEHGNMTAELPEFTYQAGWASGQAIAAKRDVLVRVLAAYAKLFRFVLQPSAQDAFLSAHKTVFPSAPSNEGLSAWRYLQTYKPFAVDLMLSAERVRYMQQINLDFKNQREMLPFDRVVDLSLAREALALLT